MLPETTSPTDTTIPVNQGVKCILGAVVSFLFLTGLAIFALTGITFILTAVIE